MDIKLEDYCCICGNKIGKEEHPRQIGSRGKTGDIPANVCDHCDYVNTWFSYWPPTKRLRFVVTKKRFLLGDSGYYVAAKPCDALDWEENDRIWLEVDRVYETRWDCSIKPERVRQIA